MLYDVLGYRIDMMLDGLRGEDGGYSMTERTMMIAYGFDFIMEKPWLGNGFNAFSTLFGNITGWYTYSHNNFIELLVNTGIVGLIIYYSLTFYIIKGLWKPALKDRDALSQILFLYTIITMVLDYAMVSYSSVPTIFRLMYTARYCQIMSICNNTKMVV
jgi:O-antigen ligase